LLCVVYLDCPFVISYFKNVVFQFRSINHIKNMQLIIELIGHCTFASQSYDVYFVRPSKKPEALKF